MILVHEMEEGHGDDLAQLRADLSEKYLHATSIPVVRIQWIPRAKATEEWWASYGWEMKWPGPYEFRAFAFKVTIVILYDDTETNNSLDWLIAHELVHLITGANPLIRALFDAETRAHGIEPGQFHDKLREHDSEETFADSVATVNAGGPYDRKWWRERVRDKFERENQVEIEFRPV